MVEFALEMCESWSVLVREITFVNGSDRAWFRRGERWLIFEKAEFGKGKVYTILKMSIGVRDEFL